MPLTPSTMTLRASSMLAPTKAMRFGPLRARLLTHSAPARVLPKPRPAIISHTRQPSLLGGSWPLLAQISNAASSIRQPRGPHLSRNARHSSALIAFSRLASAGVNS